MNKYHSNLGIPDNIRVNTSILIDKLNMQKYQFSKHCLSELMLENDSANIGKAIINFKLEWQYVFEIVECNNNIEKIGFRIPFTSQYDIIFIINNEKLIVTAWINSTSDKHFTLDKSNYCITK